MPGWELEFANENYSELGVFQGCYFKTTAPYLIETLDDNENHASFTFNESFFGEALGKVERDGFWAVYRVRLIKKVLNKINENEIWDIGAGNGLVAAALTRDGFRVVAVEPTRSGAEYLASKKILTIRASLEQLHFLKNIMNVAGVFDVLGHVNDPSLFLRQLHSLMRPGGYICCLVPAHKFLYSDYDLAIKQQRRFSKKTIVQIFTKNEFEVIQARAVFSILMPLSFILRRLPYLFGARRNQEEFHSELDKQLNHKSVVTKLLVYGVIMFDKLRLPFGLSILVLARKI